MTSITAHDVLLNLANFLGLAVLGLVLWGFYASEHLSKRGLIINDSDGLDALSKLSRSEIDRGRMLAGVVLALLVLSVIEMVSTYSRTGARQTQVLTLTILCLLFLAIVAIPWQLWLKLNLATAQVEGDESVHQEYERIMEDWWRKSLPAWPHRLLLHLAAIANSSYPPPAKFSLISLVFVELLLTIFFVSFVGMALVSNGNAIFVALALLLLIAKLILLFIREKTAPPKRSFLEEFRDTKTWAVKALPLSALTPPSVPASSTPSTPDSDRKWMKFTIGVALIFFLNCFFPWETLRGGVYAQFSGNSNFSIFLFIRMLPLLAAIPLTVYGLSLKKKSPPPIYGWVALVAVTFIAAETFLAIIFILMVGFALLRT